MYADAISQRTLIGSSQSVTDIELDTNGFLKWI